MLAYEPLLDADDHARAARTGVCLLGLHTTARPRWPTLRHVYELGEDAALFVEVTAREIGVEAYAVGYDMAGDELLTPL